MTASEMRVRTVIVAAAHSRFLPYTLKAVAAQTRTPDEIIIVGLGQARSGHEEKWEALVAAAGIDRHRVRVVPVGVAATFGEAVRQALTAVGAADTQSPEQAARSWLWLLHDDSAPNADALAELLGTVEASRAISVVGCKQVEWSQPDRLISVGAQATRGGLRFTGIDDQEIDQGQHDGRDDVLAVGTAGMLIAAPLWELLNGPDPALGPFEDGRDVSQRARLAGHRVVVAPRAVVRHARASYRGIREAPGTRSDSRKSFRARRRAALHLRFAGAPLLLVPILAVVAVLTGFVRALWRVTTKEVTLIGDEIVAPLAVVLRPGAIRRARKQARRSKPGPVRRLRPLQASWRDVWKHRRDRRLQAAAARRAASAPSELEMAERAVVARKRRVGGLAVLVSAAVLAAVLIGPTVFKSPLIGGALLPGDADFFGLWNAAASTWIASGDGFAGPPNPLLWVLSAFSALTGGLWGVPLHTSLAIVLGLAIPLAAMSAWFAAGAATRSVVLRAWAALTWALGPPLLLGVGAGRIGAVVAHLALPLVFLAVVRSLGLDRRDVVISGMVGAQRVQPRSSSALSAKAAKQARLDALADVASGEARFVDRADTFVTPAAGREATAGTEVPLATVISQLSRSGSLGAAAAAGLAFAVAVAGAPVLLPAGILAAVVVAFTLGHRRKLPTGRGRMALVVTPAVVMMLPLIGHAIATPQGWRAFVADPGVPLASDPGPAWLRLLGMPQVPVGAPFLAPVAQFLPMAATAILVIAAALALTRGTGRARPVRIGWLLVSVGIATAEFSARTTVGVAAGDGTQTVVTGWAGPGTSLVIAGLLMAGVCGFDGLRGALTNASFGWRQLSAVFATVIVVAALVVSGVSYGARAIAERSGGADSDLVLLANRGVAPVPALGLELQSPPQQARVLALTPTTDGLDAQVWRGNGPQLTESSTVVSALDLSAEAGAELARLELATAVAEMVNGTSTDAAHVLANHGIAVVALPDTSAATGTTIDNSARARLIPVLDAVLGLERVTENDSGVIWRVSLGGGSTDSAIARAQIYDGEGALVQNVPADGADLGGRISPDGTGRTLVLAERAHPSWRAWLGGTPLRVVKGDWRQTFAIPDGAQGDLVVGFHPAWQNPWRVVVLVVVGLTVLLALPTRRRRGEVA